ncbi:MAG: hypothetical protein KIT27_03970 [Legionellales bacterium]|nr:hypothetical protein [Legionellales bacterium]
MDNHYANSWELYKIHSQQFDEDFNYYLEFCKGHQTLELFAGYGRLSNFLKKNGIDIETVELEPNLAKSILLPKKKNHVCDVLEFKSRKTFSRIIAGYNSFCLLTQEDQIKTFFQKLSSLLSKNGLASLSYYHLDAWEASDEAEIIYQDKKFTYKSSYDLNQIEQGIATWIDKYNDQENHFIYKYPTKVYRKTEDFSYYLTGTNLHLSDIILDYGNPAIKESGWVEYVIQKF